jgi:hypothetical protein
MAENQFPCSWIRIRISNTDPEPDPRQPNECGSRWIRIRIHNTNQDASCNMNVAARCPCGNRNIGISKEFIDFAGNMLRSSKTFLHAGEKGESMLNAAMLARQAIVSG